MVKHRTGGMYMNASARKGILYYLDEYLEAFFMVILLGLASIIVFVQVVMRYFFESSLSWSEEAARYMFIWLIYLGISYAAKHDLHIKVDMLLNVNFMSTLDKKILCLFSDFVFLFFASVIVYLGYEYTEVLFQRNQKTASLFGLPIWVIYAAFPVGYALCAFRLLQNIFKRISHFADDSLFPLTHEVPEASPEAAHIGEEK